MPQEKSLHTNHRQRMRKRFAQQGGFSGFAEHEVLEYILYLAIPRKDTNPLAHRLIDRFGSLCQVLEASEADILTVEGAGPAVAGCSPPCTPPTATTARTVPARPGHFRTWKRWQPTSSRSFTAR